MGRPWPRPWVGNCKFGENLNQSLLMFTHWILKILSQIAFSSRTFQNVLCSKRLRKDKTSGINIISIFFPKAYKNKLFYVP